MGVCRLLACISSLNGGSIAFHAKHDFAECGRCRRIGRQHGRDLKELIPADCIRLEVD